MAHPRCKAAYALLQLIGVQSGCDSVKWDASTRKDNAMNANKILGVLSIGLIAAAIPAAHADSGGRYGDRDRWSHSRYERQIDRYDDRRPVYRRDDRRVVHREVVVERPVIVERRVVVERPVVVHRPPVRRVIVERPVYVEPAPVYHEPYPRHYPSGHIHGGAVVGAVGGAIVGAVIGSHVGHGEHRGIATVAGAIIGGVIGHGM
jgi:uncharacterized protein YcfJ